MRPGRGNREPHTSSHSLGTSVAAMRAKSRRQALHRRAAEALRDANAEAEAIAHRLTEAGLDDLAIEWWGKAGEDALRRWAYKEAIAHLGRAIAMADRAGATVRRASGGSAAPSRGLSQLQVPYGNALFAARGFGAPETAEAFARARESAPGDTDAPKRFATDYGLYSISYVRGELPSMRAHAAAFLGDVEARPDSEAGVGASPRRGHLLVRRRVSRGAGSL